MSNKYGDKYRVHNLVKFDYSQIDEYIDEYHTDRPLRNDEVVDLLNNYYLLEKDVNSLMQLLENQSTIIHELYSELMKYQLEEPIVLTKEDLELMGKAVSYYTHGRCVE